MEIVVNTITGKSTDRKVNLSEEIFNVEPNDHAIYLDVKQYLARQRQGTHSAKERSALSGSRRKIKKQKGTGTARAGDIKSPLFRGGARAFGPKPRDYSFKLNKKLKVVARKSALTYKAKEEKILVVEKFEMEEPKTKDYLKILSDLKLLDKKTMIVLPESNKNIYLSSRNLKGTKVVRACDLNTYHVLDAQNLILVEGSLAEIEKICK